MIKPAPEEHECTPSIALHIQPALCALSRPPAGLVIAGRLFQYCVCCFIVFIFYTAMSSRGVALLCRCALAPCSTVCTHTWELYSDASCCSGHGTLTLGDGCLTHLPRFCAGAKNEEFPLTLSTFHVRNREMKEQLGCDR